MKSVAWVVIPKGDVVETLRVELPALIDGSFNLKKPCWIHIRQITDEVEEFLIEKLSINELSVEDCKTEARSKVEIFDDYIFLLMNYFDGGVSRQKKLCVFWGKDYIVTIGSRRLFEEAKKNLTLEENPFGEGVGKILWLISSVVADKFKTVTDILEEQADEVEALVFKEQNPELLEDISDLSYEILTLRRALKQLRDTYRSLISYASGFLKGEDVHYFRDLLDEVSILYDRAETLHEFIQNVLNVFSSLVSFRLNEVMKTLTIFVTVLEPLMVITSFYGMNVENLPLAAKPYGIWVISVFMLGITLLLLYYFRKRMWI